MLVVLPSVISPVMVRMKSLQHGIQLFINISVGNIVLLDLIHGFSGMVEVVQIVILVIVITMEKMN